MLVALLTACTTGPSAGFTGDSGSGRYAYTAFSLTGAAILTGHLELTVHDDSVVTGSWSMDWLAGADTTLEVGPQIGSGTLAGRRSGELLLLDLNPAYADNNVGLRASPKAGGYEGEWGWDAFNGPRTSGAFVARQE
jgi:hypothetical protein